jgi:hypothetical protein
MKKTFSTLFLIFSLFFSAFSPLVNAQTKTKTATQNSTKRKPQSAALKTSKKRNPLVSDRPMKIKLPDFDADSDEEEEENDPDMPSFARNVISKEEYKKQRGLEIGKLRGIEPGKPFDVTNRIRAIAQLERQESERLSSDKFNPGLRDALLAAWTSIGPAPIPNGQTTTSTSSVSGRVTAIDVNPTNPNIAYVGTAQGGLYRTLDGGTTWTPLLDTASSLAIGAITINPVTPTQIFVGTGEANRSADSYAGVGLYRIDNAESGAPTINGPFATRVAGTGTAVSTGIAFTNTSISKILVDPTDQNKIYVGNTTGVYGFSGTGQGTGGVNGFVGLWFSENAQTGAVTFSRVNGLPGGGASSVTDIAYEPGSNNNLLVSMTDLNTVPDDSGIYRSTNASTAAVVGNVSPTFTRTLNLTATQSNGLVLAINKVGAVVTAFAAFQSSTSGAVVKSTDGGATWGAAIASAAGFCGGQCFYDSAIAIDPNNANFVYLLGSSTGASSRIFARSTDGGATFTANEIGLHADSHAVAVAPSSPSTVYIGNDGGIFKTTDSKIAGNIAWTSLNNSQFLATQFTGLDTHPIDPNFTIGGTQDNGTNFRQASGLWTRADFGDGGYAVIDQNAGADTVNVRMYHTYFNQTNAMGYARVTSTTDAFDGNWSFFGCGFSGSVPNGMTCLATAIRFYAPMERGPGNPNSLYFGSDVLYRSGDGGTTVSKVSQEPITSGVAISAIGIAPNNDNVRLVGLANGGLFGTTTGAAALTDFDPANAVPAFFVSRVVIDPTNANTAYVTLSNFAAGAQNVWKTTTLSSFAENNLAPTWTAISTGLPAVPVNAFVVDPAQPNNLYAGTDIGVYASTDGGTSWSVFGTGLPRVAVFDMAIAGTGVNRKLRIATHGKGMYDIAIVSPTAAGVEVSGRVLNSNGAGIIRARVTITGTNGENRTVTTNSFGNYRFENVAAGQTYTVSVSSKGYSFPPKVLSVLDAVDNLDFVSGEK